MRFSVATSCSNLNGCHPRPVNGYDETVGRAAAGLTFELGAGQPRPAPRRAAVLGAAAARARRPYDAVGPAVLVICGGTNRVRVFRGSHPGGADPSRCSAYPFVRQCPWRDGRLIPGLARPAARGRVLPPLPGGRIPLRSTRDEPGDLFQV